MTEDKLKAIFSIAGIKIINRWELLNQYYKTNDPTQGTGPWWLVKTPAGLIRIGWRKRVIAIDWSDTSVRCIVTEDDTTKDKCSVHAWSEIKAIEYLQELSRQTVSPAG